LITAVKVLTDKKNRQWAIVNICSMTGVAEVFVFSKLYEKVKERIAEEAQVFFQGAHSKRNGDEDVLKIIADEVIPITNARQFFSHNVNIRIQNDQVNRGLLESLLKLAKENSGRCGLVLHLIRSQGSVQKVRAGRMSVSYEEEFINSLRELAGQNNVWIN